MKFIEKRKELKTTTYSKVVQLLIIVSIGFLILFSILYYHSYQQYKLMTKISTSQFEKEANALVELNSEGYSSLINEITFWDELVNFIEKKDISWFDNSLAYLVDTNKIDYIDGYSLKGEFVSKVATSKIKSINFIPKSVFEKLYKDKSIHFYVKIPEGIVEVYGATVHPSQDPFKNKTLPRGYLFMAKLLDDTYFVNLEKVIGSKIDYSTKKFETNSKTIFFNKLIFDINGNEITSLTFARETAVSFSKTRNLLFLLLAGFIICMIIFFIYAKKWGQKPIQLIKEVLEDGNTDAIVALKKIRGEFRYIGKLFEENNNQKNQLNIAKFKAEESDKLKSSFLMNLSHEIRTPMNAINGFSDLLLNPDIKEEDKNEYIKIIQASGKNLIDIIDDLVEMSKIDSNLIKPNLTSINIKTIVESVYNAISITNEKENIEVRLVHPNDNIEGNIITDGVKLNQVLINILNNSLKFTNEGFIILEYEIDTINNLILFSVKDSGIGIPLESQSKIFNRFTKVASSYTTSIDGLGLGLAISKSYVEMLGGTISLQSQEGVGSTFTFSIALKFEDKIQLKPVITSQNVIIDLGNEELILVAEDDSINFKLIEKLLNNINFNVIRAKDGNEAVELAKNNSEIDLIFMDIKMPNLDGYGAFEKIREFNKDIPIIAQTSYSFPEEIEKIKKLGFNDFISKPLDKEKLYTIVNKLLKNKNLD